jgi:hypothetical protein
MAKHKDKGKRKRKREPRPTMLPATFEEAQATEIIAAIDGWYGNVAAALASDAGRLVMRNELLRQLRTQSSLPTAYIIDMADRGHVPAIEALRIHIATHLDQGGKWEDLSDQLRGWGIHKMMLQPVVGGYPEGGRLLVDTWMRDLGIGVMMDMAMPRWSLSQRRAAEFIGMVLLRHGIKLRRQQIERIYRNRSTMAERIAAFMLSARP